MKTIVFEILLTFQTLSDSNDHGIIVYHGSNSYQRRHMYRTPMVYIKTLRSVARSLASKY